MRGVVVAAALAVSSAFAGCSETAGEPDFGSGGPDATDADAAECETLWAIDSPCGGNGYCVSTTRIQTCSTRWWGPEYGTPCIGGATCERAEDYECPEGTVCIDRETTSGMTGRPACTAQCLPPRDAGADVDAEAGPGCGPYAGCS